MPPGDKYQIRTISMYPAQWARVDDLAARQFDGNVSLAMRRIVAAYPVDVVAAWLRKEITADEAMQLLSARN